LQAGLSWPLRAERFGFGGFLWARSDVPIRCCLFAAFLDRLWLFDCFEFDFDRDLDFVFDYFDLLFDFERLFDLEDEPFFALLYGES
jgi:hypothetical protein